MHLPYLEQLGSLPNGCYYGCDARRCWQDILSDFKATGAKDVMTHDIRGQDRFTMHQYAHLFNERVVELLTLKSRQRVLGNKVVELLDALEAMPIVTPDGRVFSLQDINSFNLANWASRFLKLG